MEIKINLLEVASELAHHATMDELRDLYNEDEMVIEVDGTEVYLDDVQDVFNRWYDFYYNIIESLKI